jgi:hypothetical protein
MLVYVRPSNEALLRARVPGAQDQCGCPSFPLAAQDKECSAISGWDYFATPRTVMIKEVPCPL